MLFDDLQLPKTRKTKTGYSTDAAVLADLTTAGASSRITSSVHTVEEGFTAGT